MQTYGGTMLFIQLFCFKLRFFEDISKLRNEIGGKKSTTPHFRKAEIGKRFPFNRFKKDS